MSDLLTMSKTILEWVRKKPFCKMYPVVPGKVYERTRGQVVNDPAKCTLCTLCAKKCPTGAIKVDRIGGKWEINPFQCIMCNECVTNCRPGSLTMDNKHAAPAVKKGVIELNVEIKKPAPKPAAAPAPKAAEAKPAEKKEEKKAEPKPAAAPAPKVEAKPAEKKEEKKAEPKKDK